MSDYLRTGTFEVRQLGGPRAAGIPIGVPVVECGCLFDPADMNCDGVANAEDIEPFICLLFDPNCVPCSPCAGDINEDGMVNAEDIEPFINILFP